MRHALALAAAVLLLAPPLAASAQTDREVEEQIVYWPLVTDGSDYRRVPYPRQAGPLLVLADTEVVIEARRAGVSYWPITREYLANLAGEPRLVEGSLEVVDGSGAVKAVPSEQFVLSYPNGVGAGRAEILRGEAAAAYYRTYVKAARAAVEKEREYQRIVARHQALVEAWVKLAAERRENLPPPPPELDLKEPEPFHAYATEPREAAVLALAAGAYTVRFRDAAGRIVPASDRRLVSFAPRDEAIGYVLRAEDRWTRPVVSFAPRDAIYTTGRVDLFFQPVPVAEYQAYRYTRLFRPQSVEAVDPSLTVWVPRPDADQGAGGALALWNDDVVVGTLPRSSWRVAQLPGVSRGFAIEEFEPRRHASLQPDFAAMRVDRHTAVTKVALLGPANAPVAGSERTVRHVSPPAEPLLFLPALLPLFAGAAMRVWARR